MKNWVEPAEVSVPPGLQAQVGGHPLVARTLVRRGIDEVAAARAFLDPDAYHPALPAEMPGMTLAAERLEQAIRLGERICVWGDFDVDGQTATTLLVSALRALGAQVSYHIPVRAKESHGVNLPVLKQILQPEGGQGAELLLTCDTGIRAHAAVAFTREQGVDVIISDHHELPAELPGALAIVNPRLLPETHPLATLPGVGVAYMLAQELYRRQDRQGELEAFLDLVALGIVADVASQRDDARYLLQRGLKVLQENRRLGMQALLELAELSPGRLTEEHIGFVIAPRLNALGRLGDANPVVEFFTTQNLTRARILAQQLHGVNARRKLLTEQVFQGALAQIERDPSLLEYAALVLEHPNWHAGVIGIVASRLVERYNRSAVLISAPPEGIGRGSARSIPGVNITAAIKQQAHLLEGFGGHAMAAGLAIEPQHIPEFRRSLSRSVSEILGKAPPEPALALDGYLPLSKLSLDLVDDLERLAPFGAGNPALVLVSGNLVIKSQSTIGRDQEHLKLVVEDEQGERREVVWWQGAAAQDLWPLPRGRFDMAYTARSSTFGGQRDFQIEWVDARPIEAPAVVVETQPAHIQVQDYRGEQHPLPVLELLRQQADVQVWCEAEAVEKIGGRPRHELEAGQDLVIWTTPPGPRQLAEALQRVNPLRVYLFAVNPGMDQAQAFLERLAGLIKYALQNNQGQVSLQELAAATAQRLVAVRMGLRWLQDRGFVRLEAEHEDRIQLVPGDGRVLGDTASVSKRIKTLLEESAAYRLYFKKADAEALINPQTVSSQANGR
jgi:single-stranded-DNA-specific exonuclease